MPTTTLQAVEALAKVAADLVAADDVRAMTNTTNITEVIAALSRIEARIAGCAACLARIETLLDRGLPGARIG